MPDQQSESSHSFEGSGSSPESNGSRFVTTSWTMVLKASESSDSEARPALAALCEAYWYPLYVFARQKGYSASGAEDLTQSFFAELLDKNRLSHSDPQRGRFRTFLLATLDNFLKNHRRDTQAIKRGGQLKILSLDFQQAETQYSHEPWHELTPERIFDRSWAIALLQQVLSGLQQQYEDSGKLQLFAALRGKIAGEGKQSYAEIASELGMKEGAVKVAVHRIRERYGQQLRLQIAKTIDDPTQVDEELKHLFDALVT